MNTIVAKNFFIKLPLNGSISLRKDALHLWRKCNVIALYDKDLFCQNIDALVTNNQLSLRQCCVLCMIQKSEKLPDGIWSIQLEELILQVLVQN